jgi:hypothetical protein
MILQKVFSFAYAHNELGEDKVLLIKHPKRDVFTLPEKAIFTGRDPDWVACEALKEQTGLGLYPDRDRSGVWSSADGDFVRFPRLEGKIVAGNVEILCYSLEVNELKPLSGNAMWIPWKIIRYDDRLSSLMRFVISLLYAGLSGWEIRFSKGTWTISQFCCEGRRSNLLDDLLSGGLKIGVHDSFDNILSKNTLAWLEKFDKPEFKEKTKEDEDNWFFRLMRRLGLLGDKTTWNDNL